MPDNNSILEKLNGLVSRYEEVSTLITDPGVIADQQRYVKLTKEYKDLGDIMDARKRYISCLSSIREAKDILAYELTSMVHGEEEAKKAQEGARAVFSTGSSEHMPTSEISAEDFTDDKIDIVTLLVKAELAKTRNEGRRAVEQGGVSVDGEKITDPKYAVEKAAFGEDGIVLKKGKKNFKKICVK